MGKPADGLGLLLMGGKGKPSASSESPEGGDDSKELAGKALLKAIERKDGAGVAAAFQQLLDCCDDDHETDVPEDDDE